MAAEMATAALAVAPADAQTLALRAHLHRRLGQREAAADDLRALAFLDPLSPSRELPETWAGGRGRRACRRRPGAALAHPGAADWRRHDAAWGADRAAMDHRPCLPPPSLFSDPVQDATP
ncbi:hypothetical protein HS125_18065 [bacterium]|nr:hypothetical protein [bacterium]